MIRHRKYLVRHRNKQVSRVRAHAPANSTTPSMGLDRIISSTSIDICVGECCTRYTLISFAPPQDQQQNPTGQRQLAKFRYSIAVGRMFVSPVDSTGNSSGTPPDSQTPRFTRSASSRKCALQGVSSEKVFAMPMTGRPSNASLGKPWFFLSNDDGVWVQFVSQKKAQRER